MYRIIVTHIPSFKSVTLTSPERYEIASSIETLEKCGWFIRKKVTRVHKGSAFGTVEEFTFVGDIPMKNKCSLINTFAQCKACRK